MPKSALFVDLPNFYSHLLETTLAEPRQLRDYFLYWFDFDRLSQRLTGAFSPIWIFYSGKRFGPRENRIEGKYLIDFIDRINKQEGTTAYDVDIPGQQREVASYHCDKCGNEGVLQWESEKGIDSSLTVRMFDTMNSWEEAYLLSGDADFVPVVQSLRRQGKIVKGAGFTSASPALIRESFFYRNLVDEFIADDYFAYLIFSEGGIGSKWLTDSIQPINDTLYEGEKVTLSIHVGYTTDRETEDNQAMVNIQETLKYHLPYYLISIVHSSVNTKIDRRGILHILEEKYRNYLDSFQTNNCVRVIMSMVSWSGIEKRVESLFKHNTLIAAQSYGNINFRWMTKYQYCMANNEFTQIEIPNIAEE